ncbi:oxidoreductase [Subtercola sp. Z020]|uniref:SDR family NAD(P)-dependent oxidoreductase n=1 Tax=Subtercola sp. Z020 TaxID=2080582 RepID=UPI000CE8B2A0|nr:SDR family oxidoreductase [Subtercola sp. Z020]PPF77514.1 oxidoreductase [Subtercola sp. Z020]
MGETPSEDEFAGRTVVVTGAAGGIGREIAAAFDRLGADLVLVDVQVVPSALRHVVATVEGDLRQPETVAEVVQAALSETGHLDVLVNAAGVQLRKPAVDLVDDEWRRLVDINLSSLFALCRAAAPHLVASGGSIVNISSSAATHVQPDIAPYGATKAAVSQLTKGLAAELGPLGVRANGVAPGYITTPMTASNLARADVQERIFGRLPLQRLGTAAEVADTVTFLASDRARYITGAIIPVDGGYSVT